MDEDGLDQPHADQVAQTEAAAAAQRPGLPTPQQAAQTLTDIATGKGANNAAPNASAAQPSPQGPQPAAVVPQAASRQESASPSPATAVAPEAEATAPIPSATPTSGGYQTFRPSDLTVRPDVMQYKAADEKGRDRRAGWCHPVGTGARQPDHRLADQRRPERHRQRASAVWTLATRAEAAGQPDRAVAGAARVPRGRRLYARVHADAGGVSEHCRGQRDGD